MATRAAADPQAHLVASWVDGEVTFMRCCGNAGNGVSRAVLTVCAASPQPNRLTLARLANEYGLRDDGVRLVAGITATVQVDAHPNDGFGRIEATMRNILSGATRATSSLGLVK